MTAAPLAWVVDGGFWEASTWQKGGGFVAEFEDSGDVALDLAVHADEADAEFSGGGGLGGDWGSERGISPEARGVGWEAGRKEERGWSV